MDKFKGSARAQIVSLFIVSHLIIISTVGNGGVAGFDQGPNAVERGINYKTPFQKLASWIKLALDRFKIPVSEKIYEGGSNAGEHIRNAAAKSFEESEKAAERSAKAAGDAAHKAAEKVKRAVPHHNGQPDEL